MRHITLPSMRVAKLLICNVVSRLCAPVATAPVFFLLLFFLFCGLDSYSLAQSGFFPLVVVSSGFLFCYLLVLPCLFLPFFVRRIYKALLLIIGVLYFVINFGILYLYRTTFNHGREFRDMLAAILATNPSEAVEYLTTYITTEIIVYVLFAIALLLIVFYALNRVSLKIKVVPRALLFIFLLFSLTVSVCKYKQVLELNTLWLLSYNVPNLNEYKQNPVVSVCRKLPDNIVIILGESFSKSHSSLYGYDKNTNPKLTAMAADSVLKIYSNVSSYARNTIPCVKSIMTSYTDECADSINWYECLTLIEIMHNAGYTTHWISNQSKHGIYDNEVGRYAELCDVELFVEDKFAGLSHKNYDDELLSLFDTLLCDNTDKRFFVVQMMGSHSAFKERYPSTFSKFAADDYTATHPQLSLDNRQLLAEYDNSILYNDSVVYEITQRFSDKEAIVFYFSDHGFDVFQSSNDYIGHAVAGNEESEFYGRQIPFMVYTTEKFKEKYPHIEEHMWQAVDTPYRTDSIMYTIIDVAGVEAVNGLSYKEKSLFK